MIYSEKIKKNSKGFVIKSTNQRILINGKLLKLIKYKEYFEKVHIFYKENGKICQRYYPLLYFKEFAGSNIRMLKFILEYKNILLFIDLKKIAKRYFEIYKLYEHLI